MGILNQTVDIPSKWKYAILKSLTSKVTIYKAIADDSHLNMPNVIRFKGRRRILIIGFAIIEVRVSAAPASNIVSIPWLKTIPDEILLNNKRIEVSIA